MIRSFVYLDSEKLRSFSSQMFEGVTESIVTKESEESRRDDQQKGSVGSGKLLADIFRKDRSSTEFRFLEDHAYTLFEQRLIEDGLSSIDTDTSDLHNLRAGKFVRVSGQLKINDTQATVDLIERFNPFGAALYRTTHHQDIENKSAGKPIQDREIERLAKLNGMQMDPKFLAALAEVIRYGYKGLLEFQIAQANKVFSAPLKRSHLREPEHLTVQKYSRLSEGEFVMLGVVTQSRKKPDESDLVEPTPEVNLKLAVRNMSDHMGNLEETFAGVGESEIVVDPIAVYHML